MAEANTKIANNQPALNEGGIDALLNSSDSILKEGLESLYEIPVEIRVVLGSTLLSVNDIINLKTGSIVELDQQIGQPIDVYVNNRLIAKGEIVVVEENIGVTLTEIISGGEG